MNNNYGQLNQLIPASNLLSTHLNLNFCASVRLRPCCRSIWLYISRIKFVLKSSVSKSLGVGLVQGTCWIAWARWIVISVGISRNSGLPMMKNLQIFDMRAEVQALLATYDGRRGSSYSHLLLALSVWKCIQVYPYRCDGILESNLSSCFSEFIMGLNLFKKPYLSIVPM